MNQPPEITTAGSSPQRITAEDLAAKGAGILERYSGLPSFSALDGDASSGQNEKWSLETSQLGDSKPRVGTGTSGDMLLAERTKGVSALSIVEAGELVPPRPASARSLPLAAGLKATSALECAQDRLGLNQSR